MNRWSPPVTGTLGALVAALLLVGGHASLQAGSEGAPATQLQDLSKLAASATEALKSGNVAAAKQRYRDFDQGWDRIEDGVRAKSRDIYRKIERAMSNVKLKLVKPNKPDQAAALAALRELSATIDAALPGLR